MWFVGVVLIGLAVLIVLLAVRNRRRGRDGNTTEYDRDSPIYKHAAVGRADPGTDADRFGSGSTGA